MLSTHSIDPSPYLSRWVEETAALVRSRWTREALEAEVLDSLRQILDERCRSRSWVERYAAACPVEGVEPAAYHLRELALDIGARVLAGIHFRGLEIREPFVGVLACERELTPKEISVATTQLLDEFRAFRPRRSRWWNPAHASDLRQLPGSEGDQRLVGGWLPDLSPPPLPPSLEVRPEPSSSPSFEAYRAMYAELLRSAPERADWISVTDQELYEECARRGGLATVRSEGGIRGVLAARPGRLRGIPCWEMIEEVFDAGLRGRGLASSIQGSFLRLLDTGIAGLVLGTIDDRNLPSYRAALGLGRQDLGGWIFVTGED